MVMAEVERNMENTSPPIIETATPIIGVDEARRLLDPATQNEALLVKGDLPDHAKHRALNELTGLSILLPTKNP